MYLYMKNYTIGGITKKQKKEKKRIKAERNTQRKIVQKNPGKNISDRKNQGRYVLSHSREHLRRNPMDTASFNVNKFGLNSMPDNHNIVRVLHRNKPVNYRDQRRLYNQLRKEGETEELTNAIINSKTNSSLPHVRESIMSYVNPASITTEGLYGGPVTYKMNEVDIIPTPSSRGGKRKKKNKTRKK